MERYPIDEYEIQFSQEIEKFEVLRRLIGPQDDIFITEGYVWVECEDYVHASLSDSSGEIPDKNQNTVNITISSLRGFWVIDKVAICRREIEGFGIECRVWNLSSEVSLQVEVFSDAAEPYIEVGESRAPVPGFQTVRYPDSIISVGSPT